MENLGQWKKIRRNNWGLHMVFKLPQGHEVQNMCLVLKLDNAKVVSIEHEQTDRQNHRQTDTPSTVLVYRLKMLQNRGRKF